MEVPPDYGDPYQGVPDGIPNNGSWGAVFAWDGIRHFWGAVINEAWIDLANTIEGGTLV